MSKHIIYIIGIITLFLLSCTDKKAQEEQIEKAIDTIPHLVTLVQKCSRLYTAEYKVHKIITHNDEVRVKGKILQHDYNIPLPVGQRKIAIPIDATIKAYIDFNDFSEKNIRRNGNRIEIILPTPHIQLTATKVSHTEIKKYVATLRRNFSDEELSNYEQQGREAIIKDIPRMEITEMAKESAAKVLVPFFVGMGFAETDITITFQKDLITGDISKMIDPTTVIEGK